MERPQKFGGFLGKNREDQEEGTWKTKILKKEKGGEGKDKGKNRKLEG